MSLSEEYKMRLSMACDGAENFVKLYYDKFDKSRHVVSKLYCDDAKLVWSGNVVVGSQEISKFHQTLPTSRHFIDTLDSQPIDDSLTGGQSTFLICVGGNVAWGEDKNKWFYQSFLVTALQTEWKVKSDCFRFLE